MSVALIVCETFGFKVCVANVTDAKPFASSFDPSALLYLLYVEAPPFVVDRGMLDNVPPI